MQPQTTQVEPARQPRQPAVKVSSGPRRHDGLVTLRKKESEDRWLEFQDHSGQSAGGIGVNEQGGAFLASNGSSGDFAEWHPRLPSDQPFEEGDVVGFCAPPPDAKYDRSYITRATTGAFQLGVISRRAIMTGSFPGTRSKHDFDTVAYCGRLPVKVIGAARAGDYLVPSGNEDGTAVARSGFQAVKLGKVTRDTEPPPAGWNSSPAAVASPARRIESTTMELELLSVQTRTSRSPHQKWVYVDADIFAPNSTVTPPAACSTSAKLVIVIMVVLCGIGLAVWLVRVAPASVHCNPIELDHGTLSGTCTGGPGSVCIYEDCDDGYHMLPHLAQSHELPSAQAASPPGGTVEVIASSDDRSLATASGVTRMRRISTRQFPPCSTCFGTDGLMCEPKGREFPLPAPAPDHMGGMGFHDDHQLGPYLYHCPSDWDTLVACGESGGTLCYGEPGHDASTGHASLAKRY
jgi:hypothetical protein